MNWFHISQFPTAQLCAVGGVVFPVALFWLHSKSSFRCSPHHGSSSCFQIRLHPTVASLTREKVWGGDTGLKQRWRTALLKPCVWWAGQSGRRRIERGRERGICEDIVHPEGPCAIAAFTVHPELTRPSHRLWCTFLCLDAPWSNWLWKVNMCEKQLRDLVTTWDERRVSLEVTEYSRAGPLCGVLNHSDVSNLITKIRAPP